MTAETPGRSAKIGEVTQDRPTHPSLHALIAQRLRQRIPAAAPGNARPDLCAAVPGKGSSHPFPI